MWERKKVIRGILKKIAPPFLYLILRLLGLTCKHRYIVHPKVQEYIERDCCVIVFWHGEMLMKPFFFRYFATPKPVYVLISQHFDGEIISAIMRYFSIHALRGSSTKGGSKALLNAIKKLQEGCFVAITPDGPKGPYHSIADGAVLLAKKTNKPIIALRGIYHHAWEMKSWDKFAIPKPFSTISHIALEPFFLNFDTIEENKALIRAKMEERGE